MGEAQMFSCSDTILYETVMVGVCLYAFVKTHSATQRVNPNANYGLSFIVMDQY